MSSQALHNDLIVSTIFQQFYLPPHGWARRTETDSADVARAARVSKAFSEHALDALWKKLFDWVPLMRLLDDSVRQIRSPNRIESTWVICARIPPERWERFRLYARRIGFFSRSTGPFTTIHPSMFSLFQKLSGSQSLFPALTSVDWTQTDVKYGAEIMVFASEFLRKANFQYTLPHNPGLRENGPGEQDYVIASVLNAFSSQVPLLRNFILSAAIHPDALDFSGFRNLTELTLRLPFFTSSLINTCAYMEHLVYLDLVCTAVDTSSGWPEDLGSLDGFHSLHRLKLDFTTQQFATRLLNAISSSPLTSIAMGLVEDATPLSFSLVQTLKSLFPTCLRQVAIQFPHADQPSDFTISSYIHPLLLLKQLDKVSVTVTAKSPTEDEIHDMIDAWPSLTELSLDYWDPVSPLSITALSFFALGCPSLRSLSLGDVSLRGQPLSGVKVVTSHRLRHLSMRLSDEHLTTADKVTLARFLDDLFPHLEERSLLSGSQYFEDKELWDEIAAILKGFKAARAHELSRLQCSLTSSGSV